MRNLKKLHYILTTCIILFFVSCDNTGDTIENGKIELPPYESMVVDFSDFMNDSNSGKSASASKVGGNWLYSRIVVGVWNTALFTTLAVPVASFKSAFAHKPEYLGDNKWQWLYTVDGFTGQYSARLTGELADGEVLWNMHLTRTGIGSFEEFLWFTGASASDGTSGHWILNQSAEFPDPMLRIDWEVENEEIGNIKYTWVRELDDENNTDLFKNSYLEYGLQEGDYNVFYNIHAYSADMEDFVDVNIKWNKTAYNGRVQAPSYFNDELWHCWDTSGDDVTCE